MTGPIVSKSRLPFITILIFLCSVSVAICFFMYLIPRRAQQLFGPPSTNLSIIEGTYLSSLLILDEGKLAHPLDPFGNPTTFEVKYGESTNSIIDRLFQKGLISEPYAFRNYLRYSGLDTSIQAGIYTISPAMSPIFIAQSLQDASPTSVNFTILAGWRLEEIAESLETSGLTFNPDEFLEQARIAKHDFVFSERIPIDGSLEGFFLPDTYTFERSIGASEFTQKILENFAHNITPEMMEGFNQQGLDIYQAVTLASIIEREAIVDEEMPLIASVFYNRLNAGIKLDADPTVQYALGYNDNGKTWWTNPLTIDHLSINSPYNTYIYAGLPPGPIANPGIDALRAVAFPAQTTYFYFRAACDGLGKHTFAETFEEQVNNACP